MERLTPLELLDETIEYYKTHNRGLMKSKALISVCRYRNSKGDMCALGRCFTDEAMETELKHGGIIAHYGNGAPSLEHEYGISNLVKDQYVNIGLRTWSQLQRLHDKHEYWNANDDGGWDLSEEGLERVKTLKIAFS